MEIINGNPDWKIQDIEKEQRIQLCFNILPQGRGILHLLAQGGVVSVNDKHKQNQNDQIEAYNDCRALFKVASEEQDLDIAGVRACKFEIPILPDMYGFTVLDYCLGIAYKKK